MIEVSIDRLTKADAIRFSEESKDVFRVIRSEWCSRDKNLWDVEVRGPGSVSRITARPDMQVLAVEMYRVFEVPCLMARHEGGPLQMLHNLATGSVPRGVICGACDAECTAEVVARMQAEKSTGK
jgi:hypothetical protein